MPGHLLRPPNFAVLVVLVWLLLALAGVPAYQQFTPGRIDHHNVQIALTLLVVAAMVWSDRKHWSAAVAGLLSGGRRDHHSLWQRTE